MALRASRAAVVATLALGVDCLSPGVASVTTSEGAAETSGTTTGTGVTTTPSSSDGATTSTSSTSSTTKTFLDPHDVGAGLPPEHCDPYAQECPEGEKCVPWTDDRYSWYDDAICVPVPRDPKQPGEPCTVEGGLYTGIDDCDEGAFCWDVDPETLQGTCVALCTAPFGYDCWSSIGACCSPDETCVANRYFGICVPTCHPLGDGCPKGEGCYPSYDNTFICGPDGSGDQGIPGDSCDFTNACDPGTFCGDAAGYPGCYLYDYSGCCTPFCDLKAPACADGTVCTPWYDPMEGEVPPAYVDLGACVIPG